MLINCNEWVEQTDDVTYHLNLYGHIETAEQRTIIQQYGGWYTGR